MSQQKFSCELAGKTLTIETGLLAQQAGGSCVVRCGDTVVLGTAVMGGIREGVNFFPLSVDYEERLYAAGKIKGSRWIKREGRPSDDAVLTSRLIDRAIRPLFSYEMKNEVQVITTVLSFDEENDSDVLALVAASTALAMSDIPWEGPLAGIRVGRINGEYVVNPSFEACKESELDLIVAGLNNKVLMIEAEGNEASEDIFYGAMDFAHQHINTIIGLINEVVAAVGKPKRAIAAAAEVEGEPTEVDLALMNKVNDWVKQHVPAALFDTALTSKSSRKGALTQTKEDLNKFLEEQQVGKDRRKKFLSIVDDFAESEITRAILEEDKRVDGRSLTQIRALTSAVGILPRTHGSGLFERGETQVLSVVTLGSPGDQQQLEGLEESSKKRYMHHYNFPPYSVGEAGRIGSPGRREIGHGALAEKALRPVLPTAEEFPYTIRVVSEVLGSNGSSSQGSVCGSTLALMDAGVPITKPVAGIAMGVASRESEGKFKVLTDLQDLEDGDGGMDFKIAGTKDGITAIQLDTKTHGIPMDTVKQTLTQALTARLEILEVMAKAIAAPRAELSAYAPRIISFKINPEKIRDVIGPGGKIINQIIDETGVQIDIEQDGTVMITSKEEDGSARAVEWIKNLTREVGVGEEFEGKVSRMFEFGAMVEILPGQEGMVHVSELAHHRVGKVSDVVNIGDVVKVKVIAIDEKGRINLSMKALTPRPDNLPPEEPRSNDRGPRPGGFRKPFRR